MSESTTLPQRAISTLMGPATYARNLTQGKRDARRLRADLPNLVPRLEVHAPSLTAYSDSLMPAYGQYVDEVSPRHMAISWESASYLWQVCLTTQPARVLDLGSGFSSYVLRKYAALNDSASVVSVDDSPEWLEQTSIFLRNAGLSTDSLRTWDDFKVDPGASFDLVFHDLAGGSLRELAMKTAAAVLSPKGIVLFDDAHHPGHRRTAEYVSLANSLTTYSLREWTLDQWGRFSLLAIR